MLSRQQVQAQEDAADRDNQVPQIAFRRDQVGDTLWMAHAACRPGLPGNPGRFFYADIVGPEAVSAAKRVCRSCPVMKVCRQWRYDTRSVGVFGGVFYERPHSGAAPVPVTCVVASCPVEVHWAGQFCSFACEHAVKAGTVAGYYLHQREGNPPACQPCRESRRPKRKPRPGRTRARDRAGKLT